MHQHTVLCLTVVDMQVTIASPFTGAVLVLSESQGRQHRQVRQRERSLHDEGSVNNTQVRHPQGICSSQLMRMSFRFTVSSDDGGILCVIPRLLTDFDSLELGITTPNY